MGKITIKELVEFRRKSDKSKKRFAQKLKARASNSKIYVYNHRKTVLRGLERSTEENERLTASQFQPPMKILKIGIYQVSLFSRKEA